MLEDYARIRKLYAKKKKSRPPHNRYKGKGYSTPKNETTGMMYS